MSVNTANTPDGRGVIIYNGEIILLFVREVTLNFDKYTHPALKGTKKGNLYLTSHRIIFNNAEKSDKEGFKSISMPFVAIRNIKLEQPIFSANYLIGELIAQPGENLEGENIWKLTFNRGGAIDFGQALLKSEEMVQNHVRPLNAPPPYAPPSNDFFAAPPTYYWTGGNYQGYQAPVHTFPEQPPSENVFMYEQPPPYPGMGPAQTNPPPPGWQETIHSQRSTNENTSTMPPFPAQPPSYNQMSDQTRKVHMD